MNMYPELTKHEIKHLRMLCKLDESFHPSMNHSCMRKLDRAVENENRLSKERMEIRAEIIEKEKEVAHINHSKNNLKAKLIILTEQLDERKTLWKHIKYVFRRKR